MKKVLIGISGLAILAFIVVLFVNAQNAPQEVKKAATETSADCAKCPSASGCGMMAAAKKAEVKTCDPAKCKEGKCNPATCKANCTTAGGGMKNCDPAKCPGLAKK